MSGGRDPHSRQFLFVGSTVVRCFCDPDDQKEIKRKKKRNEIQGECEMRAISSARRRPPTAADGSLSAPLRFGKR